MTQASPPQRTWFLKDEPLSNLQGQDRFNHNAYVNLLVKAIRELTPPFTLGVFGSWGVGKSSIVNDLGDKLAQNSSDTRTVTIDVWKYSDDSLRRQFLFDLQQDLHRQKALPKDRDYVQEVYEEKTEERPGQQRFDITRFRALAVPLILTLVLTAGGIGLLLILNIPIPVKALLAAFVAPFVLYFVSEFSRSVVVVSKDMITRPVYFSEDQFERKFEEIVRDANCSKLVIVVDNLDRCPHELVVDTLSAIKTFLEPKGERKCIFVIPCDDSAIRQHVKAAYRVFSDDHASDGTLGPEEYAVEYLRKFFSGSIKIDPFLPEEIESYIEHLLSQMKLTEDMPDQEITSLVQIVGFLFRENPRQLKQFLNNLTSKYLLAKEREAGPSPQINPPITDKRLFLAKVVAIETRFPDIYSMFRTDDNLFLEVHSAAVTQSRAGEAKSLLNDDEPSALLENFLRTTGHITADNPKAFFHLKQSEKEARIPNYAQFDSALRRGDIEGVRKAYDEGNQETNAARTDVLIRSTVDWSQKGYDSYALNAVRVAVAVREFQTTDGLHISAEVVRALATAPGLLGNIHQLHNPDAMLEMAEHALPDYGRAVRDAHVEHFTSGPGNHQPGQDYDAQLEDSIAKSFVDHIASLSSDQKNQLRTAISSWNNVRPVLLEILSSTQEAKETFIELAALSTAVRNIKAEDLATFSGSPGRKDEYDSTSLVLIRCQELGDQALGNETTQKLVELLEYSASQDDDALFWYTCKVASELASLFDMAEPDHLDGLIAYPCQKYETVQSEQKVMLVELMCRHYGRASDSNRGSIDSILTADFIPSLPAEHVAELLALHKDPNFAAAPWDQINACLSQRLTEEANTTEASELMKSIASALVPDDFELLMALVRMILERPETQRAVPLVRQVIADLPQNNKGKSLAVPVFEGTLSLSGHAADPDNKNLMLELALQHHELHTKEYKAKLDDHILELVVGSDPLRRVGFQALESGYADRVISEERYMAVLRGFADWLVQQPATTPLQAPIPKWLDKIVSRKDSVLAGDGRREAMIQWLSDRQEGSVPADERQQTLRHLVSFGRLPTGVLHELVPRLVYQAQNSPDEPTRSMVVESLLAFYEGNDPLNQDLWSDLNDYRRGLLSGDDNQKALGRKLDRKMREIRRDAGQPVANRRQ